MINAGIRKLTTLILCLTSFAWAQANVAQPTQEARPLELGKPIEREMAGGQSHTYQITLTAGQYLNVIVEQRGIDVAVVLTGTDGKQIFEANNELRKQGTETVWQVAEVSGNFRLTVRAAQKEAPAGSYEIRLVDLRAATEQDRTLQEARKLYAEGDKLYRADKDDEARPLIERSLEMREQALGTEHPDVAQSLNRLGGIYISKGDYAKAEPLFQRALAIREKVLGPEHPDVARSLSFLAYLYFRKGDYAKAEPLYQRALAILERALGADQPETLALVNEFAFAAENTGRLVRAESLLQRVLAAKEKTFGPEDSQIIAPLLALGGFYKGSKIDLAKAELLIRRALAICEKKLPPDHEDFVSTLDSLADLYKEKADYVQAESLYRRVLAIQEKKNGPEDISVSFPAWMLAGVHMAKAEINEAEALYRRALAIQEKTVGPESPRLFGILNDTALVYLSKGDFEQAEPLFQRSLAAAEKAYGPENRYLIYPLSNLAFIAFIKRDFAQEEQLRQRVLAITEKTFGPAHPQFASALSGMAGIYLIKGEYTRAEPLLQRALTITEKAYGPEHPQIAGALAGVGGLYLAQGDYAKAEQLFQRVLTIKQKMFGDGHFNIVQSLYILASVQRLKGDMPQAITLMTRGNDLFERSLSQYLIGGSERQKLSLLSTVSPQVASTIALHTLLAPNDPAALNLALTTLLQRKGRGLDVMTDAIAQLRRRATPEDQKLLDQLAAARSQLAAASLKEPQPGKADAYRAQLKQFTEQLEKLETEISSRNAEFRVQAQPVTLAAVQSVIPNDWALVEFAFYEPPDPKTFGKADPARYAAYVVTNQGQSRWVDLGTAAPIDQSVDALRQALRNPKRRNVKSLARKLDEQVMQPVRALLGSTKKVFISPDGALNLVPFGALVDERGKYLVASYSFNYLTSGRDLLRLQLRQPNKKGAMIFANPDFGEAKTDQAAERLLVAKQAYQPKTPATFDFSSAYFNPLPGTAGEARALRRIFPQADLLTQAQATEAALKQIHSPKMLHIATHGFFLQNLDQIETEGTRRLKHLGIAPVAPPNMPTGATVQRGENPLLRSGLAFAGANLHKKGDDDGILTALEASGLDLWGTKLVVLSACDTGVGEVKNGEGVYGLRRALVLAGSETQVMSLWPVSDLGTRDLMIGYYKRLLAGQGRTEALRNTQLEMLRSGGRIGDSASRILVTNGQNTSAKDGGKKDRSHPYYWASFIQSGEWANLDGKR